MEGAADFPPIEPLAVAGEEDGRGGTAVELAEEDAGEGFADSGGSARHQVRDANLQQPSAERDFAHGVDVRPDNDANFREVAPWSEIAPDFGENLFVVPGKGESELDLHPSPV